jgi:hypothetical protein
MSTVAFGLELFMEKIEFMDVRDFPALQFVVEQREPQELLPYCFNGCSKTRPGDVWQIHLGFQMIYVLDAFECCVSWPIGLELVTPVESTALGTWRYEAKNLICDAIAAHGSSGIVKQVAVLKHFDGREVAKVHFEMRVIFFKMCVKCAATMESNVREISRSAANRMMGSGFGRYVSQVTRTHSDELQGLPAFWSRENLDLGRTMPKPKARVPSAR